MDEIEKFLRQVAARRQQAQQQQQAPPPSPAIRYVEPEIVEPPPVSDQGPLSERHIDSSAQFQQRSSQMGEKTRLADDAMEQHLHEKFDRNVGPLTGRSNQVATEYEDLGSKPYTGDDPRALSDAILDLFRSPSSIRNAIILKEILEPPNHRW